jgi:HTH-type transcriptional regulator / antitoxin HigA
MEEHGLTQKDLPELGSQGVVSEILAGRRALNVRQIQALATRFGVDPGAFLTMGSDARLARRERHSAG